MTSYYLLKEGYREHILHVTPTCGGRSHSHNYMELPGTITDSVLPQSFSKIRNLHHFEPPYFKTNYKNLFKNLTITILTPPPISSGDNPRRQRARHDSSAVSDHRPARHQHRQLQHQWDPGHRTGRGAPQWERDRIEEEEA